MDSYLFWGPRFVFGQKHIHDPITNEFSRGHNNVLVRRGTQRAFKVFMA